MGLLGDIRYMLTQSHYKRTTPYVSVCVCACGGMCVVCAGINITVCVWSIVGNVGGMFVSVLDTIALHACVCVLIGCHRWVFALPIRLLIERRSSITCDKSRNPLVNKVVINSHHKFPQPKMVVSSHCSFCLDKSPKHSIYNDIDFFFFIL